MVCVHVCELYLNPQNQLVLRPLLLFPHSAVHDALGLVTELGVARHLVTKHRTCQLTRFSLRFIHSHSDSTGVFRNAFSENVALTTFGNRLDTLYHVKMKQLPGYWDADHDRPRTRNTRPSKSQCTNICINKSPTFSLRTSILLLVFVILATNRKYTTRHFSQKTIQFF